MKKFPGFTLLLLSLYLISLLACTSDSESRLAEEKIKSENDLKALTLLRNNCFNCHNPDMGIPNRIAPPMFMVRNHYYYDSISMDDFVNNMIHFINNPTEENSIMPGAVRNFGLMPKQTFKEEDLKLIAAYIYENDLESDAWYAKWEVFNKNAAPSDMDLSFEDRGLNYANRTKSELGRNLLAAIKERGAAGAVDFCNTRAIALTDSMSQELHAVIRRVSDQPRNPDNAANPDEMAYILEQKNKLANGEKTTAKVFEQPGKMIGYYPIETNKMCLQCHGRKDVDIQASTLEKIRQYYPHDQATGYGENQLRGIFVVEMEKQE